MHRVTRFAAYGMVVLTISFSTLARAEESVFVHPAGAYSIRPPQGYKPHAFVDDHGVPYYVFTPDEGSDAAKFQRGIWFYAMPVATDHQLPLNNLSYLVSRLITAKEPNMTVDLKSRQPAHLGRLEALEMPARGIRAAGAWKGDVLVAVQEDNYLVFSYGGPPAEWEAVQKTVAGALATLEAPIKLISIDNPPVPKDTQRLRDVSTLLTQVTPLVKVKWRSDGKDDSSFVIGSSGSGFIIRSDGYVITNRHVVAAHPSSAPGKPARLPYDPVELTFDQTVGTPPVVADVVAISQRHDLALLKIRGNKTWPVAPLADIDKIRLGDKVGVAGWPKMDQFGSDAMSLVEGDVTALRRDAHGRPVRIRTSTRSTHGNSGGPIYDLELGAVVGVFSSGLFNTDTDAQGNVQLKEVLFYEGVPVHRIIWEFPQVAAIGPLARKNLSMDERHALIAYYFLQNRYGAAMFECRQALAVDANDGLTNAYLYRIYIDQGDTQRAEECIQIAVADPDSQLLAALFACNGAIDNGNYVDASTWLSKCYQFAAASGARQAARSPAATPQAYTYQSAISMGNPDIAMASVRLSVALGNVHEWMLTQMEQSMGGPNPGFLAIKGCALVQGYLTSARVRRLPVKDPPPSSTIIEAKTALNQSLQMWPADNGICYANLALLAAVEGQARKAGEYASKALEESPENHEVWLAIAELNLLAGNLENAFQFIQKAREIKETAQSEYMMGWCLAAMGDVIQNQGDLKKAQEHWKVAYMYLQTALNRDRNAWWSQHAQEMTFNISQLFSSNSNNNSNNRQPAQQQRPFRRW